MKLSYMYCTCAINIFKRRIRAVESSIHDNTLLIEIEINVACARIHTQHKHIIMYNIDSMDTQVENTNNAIQCMWISMK